MKPKNATAAVSQPPLGTPDPSRGEPLVRGAASTSVLTIDASSPLPAWLQLKEQIKVAYALGQLKPGDVLPSIRSLAAQLSVGEAMVRKAYQELISLGLVSAVERKQYRVVETLAAPAEAESLVSGATTECGEMFQWATENKVSSIGLARFMYRLAVAAETSQPSYVYLSASRAAADQFAARIAQVWEVKVAGMSLAALASLPVEEIERKAAFLVNYVRFENARQMLPSSYSHLFPIRLGLSQRLVRRMRRLPAMSRIMLLFSQADVARLGHLIVDLHTQTVGAKWQYECVAFERVEDLGVLAETDEYALIVVSIHIWDQVPERARRQSKVVCSQYEPDIQSLEEIRLKAGVLA